MNQYNVIYKDKTSEPVEVYDYTWHGSSVYFDIGHRSYLIRYDVRAVTLIGLAT